MVLLSQTAKGSGRNKVNNEANLAAVELQASPATAAPRSKKRE